MTAITVSPDNIAATLTKVAKAQLKGLYYEATIASRRTSRKIRNKAIEDMAAQTFTDPKLLKKLRAIKVRSEPSARNLKTTYALRGITLYPDQINTAKYSKFGGLDIQFTSLSKTAKQKRVRAKIGHAFINQNERFKLKHGGRSFYARVGRARLPIKRIAIRYHGSQIASYLKSEDYRSVLVSEMNKVLKKSGGRVK